MNNPANWPLLALGIAGLITAGALAIHFFRHRDRRRGDRRRSARRVAKAAAAEERRARSDRRRIDRRKDGF